MRSDAHLPRAQQVEAVDVVQEGHIADDEGGPPSQALGEARRRGQHAVDAARAAVRAHRRGAAWMNRMTKAHSENERQSQTDERRQGEAVDSGVPLVTPYAPTGVALPGNTN